MPDVADDVKYSEICNKTKTTVVDCLLWMLTVRMYVQESCIGKEKKRKKKEIFRDQRYSVRKRLLVKHEDSKRDDFCNDFNFGFL